VVAWNGREEPRGLPDGKKEATSRAPAGEAKETIQWKKKSKRKGSPQSRGEDPEASETCAQKKKKLK